MSVVLRWVLLCSFLLARPFSTSRAQESPAQDKASASRKVIAPPSLEELWSDLENRGVELPGEKPRLEVVSAEIEGDLTERLIACVGGTHAGGHPWSLRVHIERGWLRLSLERRHRPNWLVGLFAVPMAILMSLKSSFHRVLVWSPEPGIAWLA